MRDGARPTPIDLALTVVLASVAGAAAAALGGAFAGHLAPALAAMVGAVCGILGAAVILGRGGRPEAGWADVLALVVVAGLVWRGWPAATPWPAFLDASWYVNSAATIAAEGGLRTRPFALQVPVEARRLLVTTFADQQSVGMGVPTDSSRGFHDVLYAVPDVERPEAVPYHPPFFTSWIAAWMRWFGVAGSGAAVVPWSAAYLLAVAALARRAFGPVAAPVAVLAVGFGPAYTYYGHTPFAETAAGALLLAGLTALAALADRPRAAPVPAAAAGLCLGLAAVVKLDVVPAVAAALAWWLLARRRPGGVREAVALGAGFAVPAAMGVVLAAGVSNLYVSLNGGGVLRLLLAGAPQLALGVLVLAAVAAAIWFGGRDRAARRRPGRLDVPRARRATAVVATALLAAAWARGAMMPETVPPSMVSLLAWTLSPLGLCAGAVGLAMALDRAPGRSGPVLAVALLAVPVVLGEPAVTRTLSPMYAARRLVPYALPVAAVLAASVAAWATTDWRRRPWPAVAAIGGLVLVLGNLALASSPLLRVRDFEGGVVLARRIAAMGGPRDVFLFASTLDGSDAGRLAAMVANLEGRPTAVLSSPDADTGPLEPVVTAWRADGRRVFAVADDHDRVPWVPGFEPRYVDETVVVPLVLAPSSLLPPRWRPYELGVVVYELVPEESG